jgi:transposase
MKPKSIISQIDSKEKKRTFYDKRLIRKIVKEVENDLPRSEAVALYGMSLSTLSEWMRIYGSQAYLSTKRRILKDSQKRSIVRAIESGMSLSEAQTVYGAHVTTIKRWLRQFGKNADLVVQKPVAMAKEPPKTATGDEVRALQKALAEAELKIAGLNTLIDIAEEQLKIDIRKKSGAKRSSK